MCFFDKNGLFKKLYWLMYHPNGWFISWKIPLTFGWFGGTPILPNEGCSSHSLSQASRGSLRRSRQLIGMGGDFASFFRHSDADQTEKKGGKSYQPGCWFQTCVIFPWFLGRSSSQLTNSMIFQRGRYTTKQQLCFTTFMVTCVWNWEKSVPILGNFE